MKGLFPIAVVWLAVSGISGAASPEEIDYFETYVEPLLREHCYECHSHEAEKAKGGLVMDSRAGLLTGGDMGPSFDQDKVESSLLLKAISYGDKDLQMPPDGKLDEAVIAQLTEWIEKGAPLFHEGQLNTDKGPDYQRLIESHWSLQPVKNPEPPAGDGSSIDRFVLAKLKAAGLTMREPADDLTLLRRLHFDLIGLPPTEKQMDTFLAASKAVGRETALSYVIDMLLASPAFGERWGRHWLDVARFAESNGKSRDVINPHAWRYRNWVYEAFAANMPYNQFIIEQLAGDLLPYETPEHRDQQLRATGFLAVGAKSLSEGNFEMDLVDDQIDTVSQSMLGLTVACARCHDHKFDPIPTADYYSLAGIFRSTETLYGRNLRNKNTPVYEILHVLGEDSQSWVAKATAREEKIKQLDKAAKDLAKSVKQKQKALPKNWKARAAKLAKAEAGEDREGEPEADKKIREFVELQKQQKAGEAALKKIKADKLPEVDLAMGVTDAKKIADVAIYVRGEPKNLGEVVERGFLSAVRVTNDREIKPGQSGRFELALWIADETNPLTARVMVNRIWQHLFGRGLVPTVDNFGISGEAPSHPALLDHLAFTFMNEHVWSVKDAIRDIVTSQAYQQAGAFDETAFEKDPENRLLWRMSRKRLEAEPFRDAILMTGGNLIQGAPEWGSRVAQIGDGEVGRGENTKPLEEPFLHRGAYLPILRTQLSPFLKTFDLPEPGNPQGERIATNVPAQSLWIMNNPFVIEQAEAAAGRALKAEGDLNAKVRKLIRTALSREPTATELTQAAYYLDGREEDAARWASYAQALMASAEFRYVN